MEELEGNQTGKHKYACGKWDSSRINNKNNDERRPYWVKNGHSMIIEILLRISDKFWGQNISYDKKEVHIRSVYEKGSGQTSPKPLNGFGLKINNGIYTVIF